MREVKPVAIAMLEGGNIRTFMDESALERLAESLKKAQKTPILHAGTKLIDGFRRVAAAKRAGITHLNGIDLGGMTPEEITDFQTVHAFHSEGLSQFDRAGALKIAKSRGQSNGEIATNFDLNPGDVTKYLSLWDCLPEVQQAAKEGKIGPSVWYAISKSDEQAVTLGLKLAGATREQVAKVTRKPKADAVRVAKLKFHVPATGHLVTIAGNEVSIDEALEVLAEASKAMREAIKRGISAKSFAAAMADIAAAN